MSPWRLALLVLAAVLAAASSTVLAVAVNVATGGTARWFPTMDRYPLWWAALAGVVAAGAAVSPVVPRRSKALASAELQVSEEVVGRPTELNAVVAALVRRRPGTVGITTGLYGAGGFGKTILARMVCADRRGVGRN